MTRDALIGPLQPLAIPRVADREFHLFRKLILRESGIALGQAKKELLVARLGSRLRARRLGSFREYLTLVEQDPVERAHMIDRISTHETAFFREPHQFKFLRSKIFPEWIAARSQGRCPRYIRVWSAGCATGEEPYSVAMMLLDYFGRRGHRDFEILATDISARVLEHGRRAVWPLERSSEIPEVFLKRYMRRGIGRQSACMRAGSELRSLVHFRQLNLSQDRYPEGPFDLILCRNVMIYFDAVVRERVVHSLLDLLTPTGVLMVGHAESFQGLTRRVRRLMPTVYALASPPSGVTSR